MDLVLIDTSVWVSFIKNVGSLATKYLEHQIDNIVIATCPTVVQEVLQGVVVDSEYVLLKTYLEGLVLFDNDSYNLAADAAQLYRSLRKKGITIRKPNDCLIAVYAIHNNAFVLHEDKDFTYIAENSDLKTIIP